MKQHAWKLGLMVLNLCVPQTGLAQARFELAELEVDTWAVLISIGFSPWR